MKSKRIIAGAVSLSMIFSVGTVPNISFAEYDSRTYVIQDGIFSDCTNLSVVRVPQNATAVKIGRNAFLNCKSLVSFPFDRFGSNIEMGDSSFKGCGIETLDLSCNVAQFAFSKCENLKSVTINGDVTVDTSAFSGCPTLTDVTFNGNPSVGNSVFSGDTNIENINISDYQKINGNAFDGCTSLTRINNVQAFDSETGDFVPEIKDFVTESFGSSDGVGFMNEYTVYNVKKTVEEVVTADMSEVEKAKALHDWVCSKVTYDGDDPTNSKNHNDFSLFLYDSSVCEGYARTFNLLLNEAGIETYYVSGVNHAWNIVKIGGHYFHIDTTWDDGDDSKTCYDYFLKSDEEMKNSGSAHSQWLVTKPSPLHDFQDSQSETLPECGVQIGDINEDGAIQISDVVKLEQHLLGSETLPDGDEVLADLNFDGSVDVFDLVSMRKNITAQEG